jgi:hypothetical protein
MRHPRRLVPLILACGLLAACTGQGGESVFPTTTTAAATTTAATTTAPTTTTTEGAAGALPTALPSRPLFAAFEAVPLLEGTPSVIPDHPTSLADVYWEFKVVDYEGTSLRLHLAQDGFAINGTWNSDLLHPTYTYEARYADGPVYVTTDVGYHEWHLVFSKALRDTEQQALLPLLDTLVTDLVAAARQQQAALTDPDLATAADDVTQYLEAVATVLGLDVGAVGSRVGEEVNLIQLHAGLDTSPTLGVTVDYSLFTPRGHYTRSEDLTRYFQAMAAFGATPFLLGDADAMRRAVLLSRLITTDQGILDRWQQIYDTTAFLVGAADDYTPVELMAAVEAVGGGGAATLDDAFLAAVADQLRATRTVLIDTEYASVRTMGARFVLDSYLLDQLVAPQVPNRLDASVLDVAAAFGSDWALAQQEAAGVTATYPEYVQRMQTLRDLVTARPVQDWGSTVYDAWLYAILPVWSPHGTEFPDYMRTEAWTLRDHLAGFGTYTELKHDTLLYAKQAFAEGDEPLPPAPPRHWVEPDPVPFERIAQAAALLEGGLAARGLLPADTGALLDRLIAMEQRFGSLARDELAGRPISTTDNDWLGQIGSEFELIWLAAGEGEADYLGGAGFASDPDSSAAIVADIFSNPTDALEEAIGGFNPIYVLVPNDQGHFQVAVGAVYSFYEFWQPRDQRLTDEEWRAMLANGQTPDRPTWLAPLYG